MNIAIYQVDAFTSNVFGGNPAAVCPLDKWLDDEVMQNIAAENNLSETAFFVKENGKYRIRWFTPTSEVDLCGHATLASSFVLFNKLNYEKNKVEFESRSGKLIVERNNDLISLNFPSRNPQPIEADEILLNALPIKPNELLFDKTTICVFDTEEEVRSMKPEIMEFLKVSTHGVIITAPGNEVDFVSRFFAPDVGINEDPVTGYAHTLLIPYWAKRLGKDKLHALQVSKRGGELFCENLGERVKIAGNATLYFEGKISI